MCRENDEQLGRLLVRLKYLTEKEPLAPPEVERLMLVEAEIRMGIPPEFERQLCIQHASARHNTGLPFSRTTPGYVIALVDHPDGCLTVYYDCILSADDRDKFVETTLIISLELFTGDGSSLHDVTDRVRDETDEVDLITEFMGPTGGMRKPAGYNPHG